MLFNEEMIEAYVSGHMTGTDKLLFEAGMAKDPLLMREVEMQQTIHSGLMAHRKAELKQRLNNIDMSTATLNMTSKVAASILLATMVGAGLYMTMTVKELPAYNVAVFTDHKIAVVTTAVKAPAAQITVAPQSQPTVAVAAPAAPQHNSAQAQNNNHAPIIVDVPNMEAPANADVNNSGDGNATNEGLGNSNVNERENVKPEFKPAVKEGVYSYQYYNGKLFLYGFKSTKANILEFNKGGKKQLFVLVNNQYYQIKDNQTEIAPLKVITDQSTINQLNGKTR